MRSFKGSLTIPATRDVVEAVFAVDNDNLVVSTGSEALGSWPLHDVQLNDMGSEIRMSLDGENVVADIVDRDGFLSAMTPPRRRRPRHKRTRPERRARELPNFAGAVRKALDRDLWADLLAHPTTLWILASAVVVGVAGLVLFAPTGLGTILILLGMVALVIAGLAVTEDLTAVAWIPGNLSETTLVLGGVVSLAIGGLLILIG